MILDHVIDGSGPVVEPAAVRNVERLGHRDLDALHVGPVEQGLDHRVGEADEEHVLHGIKGQPVIDPEDCLFREVRVHRGVELLRAGDIVAERLLHHDPGILGAPRRRDAVGYPAEQRRRHLQVVQHPAAGADGVRHRHVGGIVVEIPVHVAQQAEHLPRGRAVRVHVVKPQRGCRIVAELGQPPSAFRHPDDGHVEHAALDQPDQRRERLDLGQVAGSTKNHQRVYSVRCHVSSSDGSCVTYPIAPQHRWHHSERVRPAGDLTGTPMAKGRMPPIALPIWAAGLSVSFPGWLAGQPHRGEPSAGGGRRAWCSAGEPAGIPVG